MTTLTFTQAPHGTYATNTSPVDGVIDNAVTVSNSDTAFGQYKLDDVPYGSALPEGNLGEAGVSASFTPDVAGLYMVSLWSVDGVRLAQLGFGVPDAFGNVVPGYDARGDTIDNNGVTTLGNFRPVDEPTKGWKRIAKILMMAIQGIGTADQVALGDGTLGLVPAAALPKPTPDTRGGVIIDGIATHFYDGDGVMRAITANDLPATVVMTGAYAACAASCTHWYKFNESGGIFANSIVGGANPLTATFSEAFIYQDTTLYGRGTPAVRFAPDIYSSPPTAHRIHATEVNWDPTGGMTVDITVQCDGFDDSSAGTQTIFEMNGTGATQGVRIYISGFTIGAELYVGASRTSVKIAIPNTPRIAIRFASNGSGSCELSVNGCPFVRSINAGGGPTNPFDEFCFFNAIDAMSPFRGCIADVRIMRTYLGLTGIQATMAAIGKL
jgi:hypothetical protein